MNNIALSIEGLSKKYKEFSLDEVDFKVEKGTVMGLVGQNGAGKTTIMKLIMNMIDRDGGKVSVYGHDNLIEEARAKDIIGYIADENYLIASLTMKKHAKLYKYMFSDWDDELFSKYLKDFDLPGNKKIMTFSKGMKTKAMLALALSHRPQILVLDEPTAGLDPVARIEVLDILRKFIADGNGSVLFSTHITGDLDKIADHVTLIIDGSIVESAGIDEIEDKYVVISGDVESITGKEKYLIGKREVEGFCEAMILRENLDKFNDVLTKNPTIENILTFNIWGNKARNEE